MSGANNEGPEKTAASVTQADAAKATPGQRQSVAILGEEHIPPRKEAEIVGDTPKRVSSDTPQGVRVSGLCKQLHNRLAKDEKTASTWLQAQSEDYSEKTKELSHRLEKIAGAFGRRGWDDEAKYYRDASANLRKARHRLHRRFFSASMLGLHIVDIGGTDDGL